MVSDFKQKVLVMSIGCSLWALLVSGLSSLDKYSGHNLKSELPLAQASGAIDSPIEKEFDSICNVLNLSLPIGLCCIALLMLNFRHDRVGLGAMTLVCFLFMMAYSSSMKAACIAESYSVVSMDERVWWM